jgi:hypothetical protein
LRGKKGTFEDYSEKTFGRLVAIDTRMEGRDRVWQCQCSCGNSVTVWSNNLKSGASTSCGCTRHIRPFEALYNNFVDKATRKGHNVSITYEQFLVFTDTTKCHYCLEKISWSKHGIVINGSSYYLDRKDNSLGYSVDNCVVCCTRCNRAKSDVYSYEDWHGMTQWQRSRVWEKD